MINNWISIALICTLFSSFGVILMKHIDNSKYNNVIFIQNLCQNLNMDKKDVFSYFLHLRNNHDDEEVYAMLSDYENETE